MLHIRRHGESTWALTQAPRHLGLGLETLFVSGGLASRHPPRAQAYLRLAAIERRYRLPVGYFRLRFWTLYQLEGSRNLPNRDSVSIPTIGLGYNLRDNAMRDAVLTEVARASVLIDFSINVATSSGRGR